MRKFLTIMVVISGLTQAWTKNRTINFDEELKAAVTIKYVRVLSYSDSTMTVKQYSSGDTLVYNCKGKVMADQMRSRILEIHPETKQMQGYWPTIGESVLIFANASNSIRLLALKLGDDYKFWDPNMDLLGSWFRFSKPARPTEYCMENSPDPNNQDDNCFDGCLYPVDLIKER